MADEVKTDKVSETKPVEETKQEPSEIARLTDVLERAVEQREKVISQTPVAAIKKTTEDVRKLVRETDDETTIRSLIKTLQGKLEVYDEDVKPTSPPARKSEFSLEEATRVMTDIAGVPKAETKDFFNSRTTEYVHRSRKWKETFGRRTPIDVLMYGGLQETAVKGWGASSRAAWTNFKPLSAGSEDSVLREAQDLNDQVFVWSLHQRVKLGREPDVRNCPIYTDLQQAMDVLGKALDTTDTANWVPTSFSTALIDRYELDRNVVRQLRTMMIPRSPFQLPVMGARTTTYLFAENTAGSGPESATVVPTSDMTDAAITLTLISLAARTSWSYELDEDSILPIATLARDEMGKSMAYSEEDALINADTAGTHMDIDVTSATDVRKAWLGFRAWAVDRSFTTAFATLLNANLLMAMVRGMGIWGAKAQDLFWIIGPNTRAALMVLTDSLSNAVMIGSATASPVASVQTLSDVPTLFGLPVVVSEAMRTNMNATGIYDGTTTTQTGILLVNRPSWVYAWTNAGVTVESQRWIRTRQIEVVASTRREFERFFTGATDNIVEYGVNVPTS
jgi:HK97 family phage major capsid protein